MARSKTKAKEPVVLERDDLTPYRQQIVQWGREPGIPVPETVTT